MVIKKKTVNWTYDNKEILSLEDAPPDALGFIYRITNESKQMTYIGRKSMLKPLKKGKKREEYPWKSYTGSSVALNADIKSGDTYSKEIIRWCFSKAELTYYESQAIYCSDSLIREDFYNFWCKATVYSKHLNAPKKE
jgi:Putative endonuclease segE, GIY-YIG domain